ncbi:MAG TPA: efflux RND transporter permease subunit [Tepidisphaeraceae bacterium]|jgi:HAE1 family hydrophobic/amphiphilic exporter-1|nr:efflux RND transporter permease subunit [Tepidisphaeraceae bacterium]
MTSLSEPFIRRPAMTTLLTVTCILFGVLAYRSLPVNDLPSVDYPVITASVSYPGASPETMAANVATPLEKQFMQISGLQLVTSSSGQGTTSFTLQFDLSKSLDAAATDVQAAISQASGSLPVDLPSPPTFSKTNPNDQAIMYLAMVSNNITGGALYNYASTEVAQRISILPGVSRVDTYGTKAAVRIEANPSALAIRGMTINDLALAIQAGTTYEGAGQFDSPHRTFLLQPQGQLTDAQQYSNLIIATRNGSPVYLRDVATAEDTIQDQRISMHFWDRMHVVPTATVVLAVFRQAGTNAVVVAQSVRDLVPGVQAQLPASIGLYPVYDRSQSIVDSANDVQFTLLIAFVLVVMVIYVFLGRANDTLIPVVALPLSLLLTFIVMHVLGYSLDNLSLMALVLAVGFLVDDAIVFLENTVSRMEHGEGALEASIRSATQISFTILAMTISLAAVFLPLVFMPGLVGRIFREFAVTIIVVIFASGIVSLTLTPMMCSRMLALRGKTQRRTLMERMGSAVIDRVLAVYGRSLWWFLRYRWISLAIWFVTLFGTIWLFMKVPKSFLPVGDSGFIRGVMIGQEGASYKQMRVYQNQADKIMQANPAVETTFTMTGNSQFLPSNQGFVLAFLKDASQRPPIQAVTGQLMAKLSQIINAHVFMRPSPVLQISTGATQNNLGQYAYALSGIDRDQVDAAAMKLQAAMQSRPDMFATVTPDLFNHTPNLQINILRDAASSYGVSAAAIESTIRQAYSQNYVYLIKKPEDQFQVILEAQERDRAIPSDLSLLYVRSNNGLLVPLPAVATWQEALGPQNVNHINQFASVTIYFNLNPNVPVGAATQFVEDAAATIVPPGIRGDLQGEAKDFTETVRVLTILILLAVFVMYVILGILYESYVHPITVLSSLPVALVGGLLTLYIFNAEASLYAFIGLFLLMGIVKKNGIMLIDFALQRMAQGQSSIDAIHDASMNRFRPIIMTTLAALMGAVPIALGFGADGASRRPLGLVIVGGLIVSQFITLYITPVIYLYLEQFQERVLDRTSFFHSVRDISGTGVKVLGHEVGGGTGGGNGAEEDIPEASIAGK